MESLLSEEATLLLATLAACGFLVLGTLELIWPTRPRRAGGPTREPRRAYRPSPPIAEARSPRRLEVSPAEDRASVALRIGRMLLERALADSNPASDPRLRMVCRAIACLNRGLETAPGDLRLRETLAAAHDALATADRQTALRRLAAEMPWRAPEFAVAAPAPLPQWASAASVTGG